jgi:hypothetical protein
MVGNEHHFIAVEHIGEPGLPEFLDRKRRRDIVAEADIHPGFDKLSRLDIFPAGMRHQYFSAIVYPIFLLSILYTLTAKRCFT